VTSDLLRHKSFDEWKTSGGDPLDSSKPSGGPTFGSCFKEGYEPYESRVEIFPGPKRQSSRYVEKDNGELAIRTEPTGASVYIGGKFVGQSRMSGKDFISRGVRYRGFA